MLIKKVVLDSFGLFQGRNEFDLAPRVKYGQSRPIVLFGGKNGAGKTTLLEAVRLALYGRRALGPRVRAADYTDMLRSKVHRSKGSLLKADRATVAIEFDFALNGTKETFYVERSWAARGNLDETLTVLKNGRALDDVSSEHWQYFLHDIIPDGLSQLFFFDGEKIQEMADDDGTGALADSIKSLLGLDIVERLESDLSIYSSRQIKPAANGGSDAFAQIVASETKMLEELKELRDDLAGQKTRVRGLLAEIGRKEEHLRQQGFGFAANYDEMKQRKGELGEKISDLEGRLRECFATTLPFAACPQVCKTLEGLLATQGGNLGELAASRSVAEFVRHVRSEIKRKYKKDSTATEILQLLAHSSIKFTATSAKGEQHFSAEESAYLRSVVGAEAREEALRAIVLSDDLERSVRELQKLETDISKVPAQDTVAVFVEELADLNRRLGATRHEQEQTELAISKLEKQLSDLKRQERRLLEAEANVTGTERRFNLMLKVRSALDDYRTKLAERKVRELEGAVVSCFNSLCRKGDILKRMDIDASSFAVKLHTKHGESIAKQELSSGEKQLYSIALLWGLAKTSERPLPIIIDTPLGRLDSEHRLNLTTNYFPRASHQVILLSTDTEIDKGLFAALSPNISHAYHLVYDKVDQRTVVKEEYFWKD